MSLDEDIKKVNIELCPIKFQDTWRVNINPYYKNIADNNPDCKGCNGLNINCRFHPQYQSK